MNNYKTKDGSERNNGKYTTYLPTIWIQTIITWVKPKVSGETKGKWVRSILNKYEKTTVIIMRCEQINSGFLPLIDNFDKFNTIEEIVEEELKQKKIPFIIKRNLGNKYEYWKLEDLNII